ncbi:RAPH1 family protein [Megaselia abdita]
MGLEIPSTATLITPPANVLKASESVVQRRVKTTTKAANAQSNDRNSSYRFSMANLEESHESELDAILGELSLLEQRNAELRHGRTHSRTNSTISGATNSSISSSSDSATGSESVGSNRESRTESPDNDSAFSDTVSLLSSESSASSGVVVSAHHKQMLAGANHHQQTVSSKAAKIQLALQKLENPNIQRLFVKAFSSDGASKSLLVDERMTCGHVTRLLADKNHVPMEPHWALVEQFGELQMERLFEDHELLVENLMFWNPDSKNRVMFLQRFDKVSLFATPEKILPGTQMAPGSEHDDHTRAMLIEEFFSSNTPISMEGPLYLKSDSKKGWKRHHFVLRQSGIYYYPKEKTKSSKDLICLTLLTGYNLYRGISWKKKFKSPTDFTFALKSPADPSLVKSCRSLKMLCADEQEVLEKWVTAIRVAKYGKNILDNHKNLIDDLTREASDKFSANRCNSISSIVSAVPSQCSTSTNMSVPLSVSSTGSGSSASNGRLSRASSSSSSGCLSDDNNGFDSEFTTGTIKRKPSMKPNLPLTSMTRQLKEVGETTVSEVASHPTSPDHNGTLTRRHSRRRSEDSNNSGTLKRRPQAQCVHGSVESMNSSNTSTPTPSAPGTPLGIHDIDPPLSPLQTMPTNMSESMISLPPPPPLSTVDALSASTLSLDSLPPPPPPDELMGDFYGSQVSLVSLPPPPIDVEPIYISRTQAPKPEMKPQKALPIPIEKIPLPPMCKQMKPTIKAPPYKHPPTVNGTPPPPNPKPQPKCVKFADSPVLLRRKVSFEDQVYANTPSRAVSNVPAPPPRADATRLSVSHTSPKRLSDSTSNPPQNFLKDLQRVMRKKWQIAQKCKLEPATTPHEVLGFRDFNEEFGGDSHYYRETANVSNWVQEHYGKGVPNEYALYENLGNETQGLEPQFAQTPMKKRPPPPPPKRSNSTQLTHRA